MSGRLQREEHVKDLIKANADKYPPLLETYFRYGAGKQVSTKMNYVYKVRTFCDFLTTEKHKDVFDVQMWAGIEARDIRDFIDYVKIRKKQDGTISENGPSVLHGYRFALSNFFNFLVREGYAFINPVPKKKDMEEQISCEITEIPPTTITLDEIFKFVDYLREQKKGMPLRDEAIFMLILQTGLRKQEVADLDLEDIDFKEKRVYTKGKRAKEVYSYLDDGTIEVLQRYIKGERESKVPNLIGRNALFIRETCEKDGFDIHSPEYMYGYIGINIATIDNLFRRCSRVIGKHVSPHDGRHTAGTLLYQETGDIYAVKEMLHHSNIATTVRYINDNQATNKTNARTMGGILYGRQQQ